MAPSITEAGSDVNVKPTAPPIGTCGRLALLGWLLLGLALPAFGEVVYIRNQRLSVHQVEGSRVVQWEAFKGLLTPEEEKAVFADGKLVTLVNSAGERRVYELTPYGELPRWEEALEWLGYQRTENAQTGVVDWVNASAGAAASQPKVWTEPSEGVLASRREVSQRRSGYRTAEKNYQVVMNALGEGGSPEERRRIRRLGYQIVQHTPLAELHWTFSVARTPIPNALCTGEGFVVITEGLLALNLTDDEMAGVLGHEIAHGVRRHAQLYEERYGEARRLLAELEGLKRDALKAQEEHDNHRLQTIRSRVNAMVPRLDLLADFVKNQQAYNQHEEEEADIQGMSYAAAAGFDPNGEGRALIKLRARSIELFGQAYQEGSRTHPPLQRRLEIQSLVQKRWQAERDRASK